MRVNPAVWALVAASILSSAPVASAAALKSPAGSKKDIDISKGTEVIEPGSKEAQALHDADKASKFAPKDNTFAENFDKGNSFKKPEPKLSDQKIDVPDNDESLTQEKKKKVAATKDDNNPVVVNDYDPNNMGVSSEGKTKAQEKVDKDIEAGSKVGSKTGNADPEPATGKDTTLEKGNGLDPEAAAAAVAAGAAAVAGGAGPGGAAAAAGAGSGSGSGSSSSSGSGSGSKSGSGSGSGAVAAAGAGAGAGIVPEKTKVTDTTVSKDTPVSTQKLSSYLNFKNPADVFREAFISLKSGDKEALRALAVSISTTVLSEIGDKTFLIAAIMAMRHNRATVFTAAFSALAVMTVISGVIGHALPTFLSRKTSALLAGLLFLFFGINLFREGLAMEKNASVEEELEEVESEINATQVDDLELGLADEKSAHAPTIKRTASNPRISGDGLDTIAGDASLYVPRPRRNGASGSKGALKSITEGLSNLFGLILSPIWVQTFAMTFFAEWGDRSQVATIAMAAGSDYWWVIIGSIFGHFICTGSAVIGGKLLATKITLKNVTLTGALLFLVFAIFYFWEFIHT